MTAEPHSAPLRRHFASDNYAGICPEAWQAMSAANTGHAPAYGDDPWTAEAANRLRELFETDCEVYFVFNGTAANALALASMCQSYHSIICHDLSHVETDECGAPEFFSNGTKLLLCPGAEGRVDPNEVAKIVCKRTDIHYPKPRVLTVTQSTELGTVYSVDQLGALGEVARAQHLKLHMDGARFANAIASLNVAPKEVTWKIGVDVLCFGGTKNGMSVGEAVVFFNKELAHEFGYRCKQAGQLSSKMRFTSAQWAGMLASGAWLKNARHANERAAEMETKLAQVPGIEFLCRREANAVFVRLPVDVCDSLRKLGWRFYTFIGAGGCRLMCSWDTASSDIDDFVADLTRLMTPA